MTCFIEVCIPDLTQIPFFSDYKRISFTFHVKRVAVLFPQQYFLRFPLEGNKHNYFWDEVGRNVTELPLICWQHLTRGFIDTHWPGLWYIIYTWYHGKNVVNYQITLVSRVQKSIHLCYWATSLIWIPKLLTKKLLSLEPFIYPKSKADIIQERDSTRSPFTKNRTEIIR